MYIGGYLFLIVLGALLRWAVTYSPPEFDIQTAGLIIMVVGIIGLLISTLFWFDRRGRAAPGVPGHYGGYRDGEYLGTHEHVVHEHIVREEPPRERVIREYVPPPREQDSDRPYDHTDDDTEDRTEDDTQERASSSPDRASKPRAGQDSLAQGTHRVSCLLDYAPNRFFSLRFPHGVRCRSVQ